jgi:hypothetical protein
MKRVSVSNQRSQDLFDRAAYRFSVVDLQRIQEAGRGEQIGNFDVVDLDGQPHATARGTLPVRSDAVGAFLTVH